jgi:hypothetical protein
MTTVRDQTVRPLGKSDELFAARTIDSTLLCRTDLADLMSGVVAAVRVRQFLSVELCQAAMARLNSGDLPMEAYDQDRVDPPIARFGPVINDFNDDRGLRGEYWARACRAREAWQEAMASADPVAASIAQLARVWAGPIRPARVGGRTLFAGAVREINEGALIHYDDVRREYGPGLFDEGTPVVQLAFNAWISIPCSGGTTRIWRRRWNPADTHLRQGYGYGERAVDGQQSIALTAAPGDALFFDPRNFHSVDPTGGGRRIAVTFFMGLTVQGKIIIWS